MKFLFILGVLALCGCGASSLRPYDCLPVVPTVQERAALDAAAQSAGPPATGARTVAMCLRRVDGFTSAYWDVKVADDGGLVSGFDDVACHRAAPAASPWTCSVHRVRKVKVTAPGSDKTMNVVFPPTLSASEARRLSQQALRQRDALTAANGCTATAHAKADFADFRKHMGGDAEWTLAPTSEPGHFRIVHDTSFFLDFEDAALSAAPVACWGILEILY